ncbi:MAG: hypothetical protein ACTSO9_05430, partial [Candidatus Helarchaeota archaeon]
MRLKKKNKLLISALAFTLIFSAALPYISTLIPSFNGYNHDIWGGLFWPQMPSDIYNIYKNPDGESPNNLGTSSSETYTGQGSPMTARENATTTNSSQWLDISSGLDEAFVTLAPDWDGYFARLDITNCSYRKQIVSNPTFSVQSPWTSGNTGQSGLSQSYEGGYVRTTATGGFWSTYTDDRYNWWEQTASIGTPAAGTVLEVAFSFDFRVTTAPDQHIIYVQVEGQNVAQLISSDYTQDQWYTYTVPYMSTASWNIADGIHIRLGMRGNGQWYLWGYTYEVDYDNVYMYLRYTVQPSSVNLQMDGISVTNDAGYGNGHVEEYSSWTGSSTSTPASVTFTSPGYSGVQLTASMTMNTTHLRNTTYNRNLNNPGTNFDVSRGVSTEWDFFQYVYNPPSYENYFIRCPIPTDWDITSVLNPYQEEKISSILGGDLGDGYFIIPSSITNVAGFWEIIAQSNNYLDYITPQKGPTWTNSQDFRVNDNMRIRGLIDSGSGPPSGVGSTQANITIIFPNGTQWISELRSPNGGTGEVLSTQNTILSEPNPGNYTVFINWDDTGADSSVDEAGSNSTYFLVTHTTELTTIQTSTDFTVFNGDDAIIKIIYNDTDNGNQIDEANVTAVFNDWTGPGSDYTVDTDSSYMFVGGGNYIIALPTTADNLGLHTVDVYGEKSYYDSANANSMFTITVLEDTSLSYIDVPVIPYGANASVEIYADNSTGPLRNIDDVESNVTIANWAESSPGVYSIELDTDTMSVGSYIIAISINKTNHYNRTVYIPMTIRNITSDFTYVPPGQVYWSDTVNASITLYYNDLDNGVGIEGATLELTDWSDSGGIGYNFVENVNYTFVDVGSGEYKFEVKMDNLTDVYPNNRYTFNFSASKPNHNPRTLSKVNMTIVATNTKLDSPDYPASIIPQGVYNITIEFWDLENVVLIDNSTPTTNPLIIKYQWDNDTLNDNSELKIAPAGDYWELEIDTTGFDLNQKYNLTVNASKNHYDFAEMNISISLRKSIAVLGVTYPEATVWAENVSFYVSYTDQLGVSLIDNATVDLYYDNEGTWTEFPAGWWYRTIENASEFSTIGNDTRIYLNTSALNLPDSGYHTLNITVSALNYDTRSVTLRMYVRAIDAQIFYDTPPIVRYGENSTFHITYRDAFHDELINSSNTNIYVDLDASDSDLDGDGYYNWSRDLENENYEVSINTTYWSSAGTYSIRIWANYSGAPYYENVSIQFLFTSRNGSTEILYIPPGSIAWGFNITTLKIQYHDTDTDTYPDITNPDTTVYINGTTNMYESITGPDANNYYSLTNIYTEDEEIGTIYLNITITKTHFDTAERIIPITIRRHNTELLFLPPGQIPWGRNVSIQIWYHDMDMDNYPIMDMSTSLELSISGSNVNYGSVTRVSDYYLINDIKMDDKALGTYYLNITITNSSDKFDTATTNCTLTVRNVSTSLSYSPPGIIPYSASENATFDIIYEDEFGVGIADASINLTLLYEDGSPTNIGYVYNTNWTYYYQGSGTYTIHIDISNLKADNTKYTFKIDVNKSNYVSQTLASVNMTIRSTYTRLSSPQAPSSIIPLGVYNITIYYEDRENGVRINNGTSPPYVNMTINWDNSTMQARSQLIQVGTTDTYWELNINTTEFDIGITYNLTIIANKTYYEQSELNITIQLKRNQPIMGITAPESTVWGENVTFNVTYTTLEGSYIPDVTIDMDWYKGAIPYFAYTDLYPLTGDKVYNVTLDTSAKPLPVDGYYWVEVNCSEATHTYETLSQSFKLNIRAIDTQILYNAPQITPYQDNVTFTIEYRDTFHDVSIDDQNVTIIVDLNASEAGIQGDGYYSWVRVSPNYAITINSTFWSKAGSYPIIVYAYWYNIGFPNEPYYANASVEIDFTIRNRTAQILYTPIGSIPWGQNVSITIDFYDIDSSSYIDIPDNSSVSVSIGGTPVSFDYVVETTSWTIYNINTSKLTIGDYEISITIRKANYSDTTQNIPLTIRAHGTEILYIPPETIPWGFNITQLQIWFHDTDNDSNYPALTAANVKINETGENLTFGSLTQSGNSYYINDINVSWITTVGTYYLNITIISPTTNYRNASVTVPFELRTHRTELLYTPPDKIPWGYNLSVDIQFHDIDNTTNYPSLIASQIKINETGENLAFLLSGSPPTYTLNEINTSWIYTQGTHYLNISITPDTSLYNHASTLMSFQIRAHTSELLYTPPEQTPWSENSSLTIQFRDTDLNSYPYIDMNDDNVLQINSTTIDHGVVTRNGSTYIINEIDTDGWEVGNHILNITVTNSSYDARIIYVTLIIRPRRVLLTGLSPNPTPFGNIVYINVNLKDLDDPSKPGLNFTSTELDIRLLNSSGYNWIPSQGTWLYGSSEG